MQNLKKVTFTALLAALLLLLASCGQGLNTPTENSPQTTLRIITSTPRDTATPTITPTPIVPVLPAEDLAGTQLDIWYLWPPEDSDPRSANTLDEIIQTFNQNNENDITLIPTVFTYPEDFEAALEEALNSAVLPDIVLAHPYQYLPWAESELLVDLTPYMESSAYGYPALYEDFYPVFAGRDDYEGQRWGLPGLFNGQVLLYNQTWANQLGYSAAPANADAFKLQACTATESTGYTGGWMIAGTQGEAAAWLLAFAGSLEKSGQYRLEADEVKQAFTFLSTVTGEGCAWAPTEPYPDQAFINRQGLFYPVSVREIPFVVDSFNASNSTDRWSTDLWSAIGYPNNAGDSTISIYGSSYVIVRSSTTEQLAAWLAIRSLVTTDNQVALSENNAYLPLSRSALSALNAKSDLPEQWFQAADLLEGAAAEPRLASWKVVRSIVQDAFAEVVDVRFEPGTLSLLVRELAEMAAEFNQ